MLGRIYHYGEGSIPRAYYCYSKACHQIERVFPAQPESSESAALYELVIEELGSAAQQLEHGGEDEPDRKKESFHQQAEVAQFGARDLALFF